MSFHKLVGAEHFEGPDAPVGDLVEIGSARAEDATALEATSTWHFARLAEVTGRRFHAIDLDDRAAQAAAIGGVEFIQADGIQGVAHIGRPLALVYLDNHDVIYDPAHEVGLRKRIGTFYESRGLELGNRAAALTHLAQAVACLDWLSPNGLIALDDTMFDVRRDKWWGKGALALPMLLSVRFVILRLGLRGVLLRAPGRIERPPGTLEAIAARHAREVSFGVSPFADPAAAMP